MQHMLKKTLLLFSLLFCFTGMIHAETYQEGKHFKRIDQNKTVDNGKVEVLEFFMYGCPHCYSFEPYLNKWKGSKPENVEFIRVSCDIQCARRRCTRVPTMRCRCSMPEKKYTPSFSVKSTTIRTL